MSFLERLSALGWFLLAAAWFLLSDVVALRAASGLTSGETLDPLYRFFQLFLLVLGFTLMSLLGRRRLQPRVDLGLQPRPGRVREWLLGAAVGWSGVVACVLPTALIGGLVFTVFTSGHQFWVAALDLLALAVGTLAVEVAFRGFAYFRLVDAMGPAIGTLFMAAIYAIWRTHATPTSTAAVIFSFLFGWVLALAALRTRALWVSWGLHFSWAAVMSMLFGLPIAGGMNYSPVFATNAVGPAWITGGPQGPEGSAFGIIVAFALLVVIVWVTSDLHYQYGFPDLVPGGIPVDLDAAAHRQHEAAMGAAAPAEPQLVQIQPVPSAPIFSPAVPAASPQAVPADALPSVEEPSQAGLSQEKERSGEEPPDPEAS